ncbi:MAG: methyltransferase domain-containing protein, partial [Deltaproteobacteria bacterium]|nr:methyltransferase domain-containing protein [Deltaproteobacteria bacterium]
MTTKAPKKLSDIYGKGYFYGENSGYPAIGYDQAHPSWKEAIDFVKSFKEIPMQWLDVGCAFGYFLKEADEKGVSAFGVDISEYALQQLSDLPSKRSQSLAESLPFRNDAFDVVTAFDLVEHLYNPAAGLEEMVRVLKPGGVFLLTTPDPLLFNRDEETHFSEKPPSFWMKQMDTLGLTTRIRFFGEPFNVEILAIKRDKNSPANGLLREALAFLNSFNHDYFGERADILQVGPGPGYAVLRAGWSALHEKTENQSVRYFTESATLYIYNDSNKPMEVAMNIRCGREVPIKIYTHTERIGIERMQEEDGGWRIEADRFLVSPGGHQIELRCDDKNSVEIQAVSIDSKQKDYSEYNTSLPVDQYQRYKILQDTVNIIREQHRPQRILEVGGSPGQLTGFLPDDRITIADMEYCDIPDFQYADGLNLPFTDESFDIAASIDVLEHIAPKDRKAFITELVRVSKECVFLGAPFADPALREAEHILSEFIHTKLQHTHRFLDEHLSNPLPNREETIRFFQEKGLDTIV